ncbi:MAG: hypothetical protein HOP12_13410 [Candidatus Eisenbacteria bacterium]|uniref:Uncharacterized protein n=1 Tax=Eiseniibacteriota bacterium TaxID=2212470 RepID=A0A849SUU4_UNCEI|nr:hypothetical protein [Candidatus Eisenbacteria bacterium]
MFRRSFGRRCACATAFFLMCVAPAVADANRAPGAPDRNTADFTQRIDANQLSMVVSNVGSFGYDLLTGGAGLEYPGGSGRTVLFAGGIWVGAMVDGAPRVTVAEYEAEYGPGPIIGGLPADPTDPRFKVYKLFRDYPSTAERDAARADYFAGAVPFGAPAIAVLGPTGLAIRGDQMTWSVANDADASLHTSHASHSAPLGIELRTTFNASAAAWPYSRVILGRIEIRNASTQTLAAARVGVWLDPDLGGHTDDLVACIPDTALGYCYNATNTDAMYGSAPPAFGVRILRVTAPGPPVAAMSAFFRYVNGTDPTSALQCYRQLAGLAADGSPIIDPTSGSDRSRSRRTSRWRSTSC